MTRGLPSALSRLLPLAAALIGLAVLVIGGAPSARAQPADADLLWEATLTPRMPSSDAIGCSGQGQTSCDALLSDNSFTIGGADYSFIQLLGQPDHPHSLYAVLNVDINAELAEYSLCMGTTDFPMTPGDRYVFAGFHDTGWTDGVPVELSIRRVCSPLSLTVLNQVQEGSTATIVGKLNHGPVTAPTNYWGVALGYGVLDVRIDLPEPPQGQTQTRIQPGEDTFRLLAVIKDDGLPEERLDPVTVLVAVDLNRDGKFELKQTVDFYVAGEYGGIAVTADSDTPAEGDRVTVTLRAEDPSIIRPYSCIAFPETVCEIPDGYGWWVEVITFGTATLASDWPPPDGGPWDYYGYDKNYGTLTGNSDMIFLFTPEDHTHTLTLVIHDDDVDDDGETIYIKARDTNNPGYDGDIELTIRDAGSGEPRQQAAEPEPETGPEIVIDPNTGLPRVAGPRESGPPPERDPEPESAHGPPTDWRGAAPPAAAPPADPEPRPRRRSVPAPAADPDGVETRGDAVDHALRRNDIGCPPRGSLPAFSDVPDDHPHSFAVGCAAYHGIVLGYGDGTFRPDEPVTPQQLSTIRQRAFWHSGD